MSSQSWKNGLRVRTGRPLLVAFVVCWLGLAVQPCSAMADMDHHDAPPCDHCPDQAPSACELGSALECDLSDASGLAQQSLELPPAAAIQLATEALWVALPSEEQRRSYCTGPPGGFPPPDLQQRYCRFLK
ncbi:MAG: hypothetical protein ACO4B5_02610 [Steroidobacteraceae bacterium]